MDGLSALSLAASVAQFIEFGCRLVSKSKEIYISSHGATKCHVESAAAAERLVELSERMKASLKMERTAGTPCPEHQQSLEDICDGCIKVSGELLVRLDKLKVEDCQTNRRWKSFRQALKSVWSKSAIDEIAKRLNSFKKELDGHVLISLRQDFQNLSILQDHNFATLDATLQKNIEFILQYLINMDMTIQRMSLGAYIEEKSLESVRMREMDDMVNAVILASLRFPTIGHREDAICEAHKKTCSWVFKPSSESTKDSRPWSNFVQWLLNDGEVYWINGKAGSGKSTLMKYIYQNPATTRHLQSWAGGAELQIARYYFWNGGSEDQRSHTGLLRSLLYEILNQRRDLIRQVFEDEWKDRREVAEHISPFDEPTWSWSFGRLETALCDLGILSTDRFNLCLLIDGLDECEGDSEAVIRIFQRMSKSPFVKVCLSSRPWLIFDEAFGQGHTLRLESLTYWDIREYVKNKLDANPKMQQLLNSEPLRAANFSRTIVAKANGVFLWVKLVVASLLNGLRNQDEMSDLQRRLELIPPELDDLYDHMLGRIEPMYLEQASKIFQIFNVATELTLQLSLLELELAVSSSFSQAMEPPGNPMSAEEIKYRCLRMRSWLKCRCEGLLETHDHMDRDWAAVDIDDYFSYPSRTMHTSRRSDASDKIAKKLMVNWRVSYLHRTVKDYLASEAVQAKLRETTKNIIPFDPNLSLLQSYVLNLKFSICSCRYETAILHEKVVWKTVEDVLLLAERVSVVSSALFLTLLREFNTVSSRWYYRDTRPLFPPATDNINSNIVFVDSHCRFLLLAVVFNLESYIKKWLEEYTVSLPHFHERFLECSLYLPVDCPRSSRAQALSPSMAKLLLQHGADPNAPYSHNAPETIWQRFLRALYTKEKGLSGSKDVARIMEAMLQSGADPRATLSGSVSHWLPANQLIISESPDVALIISEAFANKDLVDEIASLSAILEEQKTKTQPKEASPVGYLRLEWRRPWSHRSDWS